ncbi:HNH endonuclease signature motif containing protein [Microbacterium sp.]|uniref:HNH endonuclease signature motif containing protein n=1 Tax=Microbacterium sp. TaxID=51671 RepID=UPI002BC7181F|nr:HNH endonuclease signature motif containing protein [Microbacterium sp.]HWK76759.1 HNH endonuclease signature motif containing protein [Microbacterium sp.]
MTFAAEITDRATALVAVLGADVESQDVAARAALLSDADAVLVAEAAAALMRCAELAQVAAVGVIATRSTRDAGQSGLAQSRGHRTALSLVQELTGAGKADAARKVRVGESLLSVPEPVAKGSAAPLAPAWDAALSVALSAQTITAMQSDAIRQGLGEPVVVEDDPAASADSAAEAWALAAEHLIAEAAKVSLDELRQTARSVRDRLDPEGAKRRFLERYERRSFRLWMDADGNRRGSILFDDEGWLQAQTLRDNAMRPRRGGPRFVDSAERERAADLTADERTNDQLTYDLLFDVVRTGTLADAETVFGTRQAGVRLVRVVDEPMAHAEDGLTTLPGAVADQHVCDSGYVPVTVDGGGNPLDVGREQRLFTSRQRIGLAVRDGGCMWRGCDRTASYCEAHHIDEWSADCGRTDIDRGILLCRFHHMNLHHHGWRITRNGKDDFVLHPPGDRFGAESILLQKSLPLTYAWAAIDPPSRRFRPAG